MATSSLIFICCCLICSFLSNVAFDSNKVEAAATGPLAAAQLARQCENFSTQVKTVDEFSNFAQNFKKLDACLRKKNPDPECIKTELGCQYHGFTYRHVIGLSSIADTIRNGQSISEVCNFQLAANIFRLGQQLRLIELSADTSERLSMILGQLGRKVATECRASLSSTLNEIESRAKDSRKYIFFLNAVMQVTDPTKLIEANDELLARAHTLAPVLETESRLMRQLIELPSAPLRPIPSSFTYKVAPISVQKLKAFKMSCDALKLYHLNVFGTMGLLTSGGYLPAGPNNDGTPNDVASVNRWIMSVMICQLVNSARLVKVPSDAEQHDWLQMSFRQDFDVSLNDEADSLYSSFKLSNERANVDNLIAASDSLVLETQAIATCNRRKFNLIWGPNERSASVMPEYLHVRKSTRDTLPGRLIQT